MSEDGGKRLEVEQIRRFWVHFKMVIVVDVVDELGAVLAFGNISIVYRELQHVECRGKRIDR